MKKLKSFLKKVYGKFRTKRHHLYPRSDWAKLLLEEKDYWKQKREEAKKGPRVLIATSTGGHKAITPAESMVAVALTLRGAKVEFLLCDGVLPGCLQVSYADFKDKDEFLAHGPTKSFCESCLRSGMQSYGDLGLKIHRYSDWVNAEENKQIDRLSSALSIEQMSQYQLDGLAVGEHALAGALRYFAKGSLSDEPTGEQVLRRYFQASLMTAYATRRLFEEQKYEASVFHHGIYIPQGVIGEVARQKNVRVVNWNMAYRKKSFIFSHQDTYHHTLMDEPVSDWEDMPWTEEMNQELDQYLKSRWYGTQDWIGFHEKPQFDLEKITSEIGIDLNKPCIGMLSNVVWDAQLHYPKNVFKNMVEWAVKTIDYFSKRPELQLVIRVHPAEIRGTMKSRQPLADEIRKVYPELPPNVFLIGPESQVSTYAVMEVCDSAIIYGTKTGVELSAMGIPVIVAGEAWIRGKGMTYDAQSQEHYFEILGQLPLNKKLDSEVIQRARKYAYHFFFRRMIPVEFVKHNVGWPPYGLTFQSFKDLLPGSDPGIDTICDGVLNQTPFIFPAEKFQKSLVGVS